MHGSSTLLFVPGYSDAGTGTYKIWLDSIHEYSFLGTIFISTAVQDQENGELFGYLPMRVTVCVSNLYLTYFAF